MMIKEYVKKIVKKYLTENDELINMRGTQHNQINIIYKLNEYEFSYVPSNAKYFNVNTTGTLISKLLGNYDDRDEQKYQKDIREGKFFFIQYNGGTYIYSPIGRVLYNKYGERLRTQNYDEKFVSEMNDIIENTLNKLG